MDKLKFDFFGWMWILLISLIVILLLKPEFSDSSESEKEEIKTMLVRTVEFPKTSGIYVFEIDGHEYIYIVDGYRSGVCHKADCKYCKKEQR